MKFGLTNTLIERFSAIFSKYESVEEVIIYGSRAKNTFREGSDIDFSVKGKNIDYSMLSNLWLELDGLNSPYIIDLSIYSSLTSKSLKEHIDRIGKKFYLKKDENVLI